jgi:small subunit ribosomal protein S6
MNDEKEYAASFILDMRGCTETVDFIIQKLSRIIVDLGGQVSQVENLGQKNFERVANRKFSSGIYLKISFSGPSGVVEGIRSKLKLDKTINRILIESVR